MPYGESGSRLGAASGMVGGGSNIRDENHCVAHEEGKNCAYFPAAFKSTNNVVVSYASTEPGSCGLVPIAVMVRVLLNYVTGSVP